MNDRKSIRHLLRSKTLAQLKTVAICKVLYTIISRHTFANHLPTVAHIQWVKNLMNDERDRCYGLTTARGGRQSLIQFCKSIHTKRMFFVVLLHEVCHWATVNHQGFGDPDYTEIDPPNTDSAHGIHFRNHVQNCLRAFEEIFDPPLTFDEIAAEERWWSRIAKCKSAQMWVCIFELEVWRKNRKNKKKTSKNNKNNVIIRQACI